MKRIFFAAPNRELKKEVDPMPKLSVIVPVYNTEKYLRDCIKSILAQTFTDFELILVDDGSTDASGAICDEYGHKDGRIAVIHQPNGGVTAARKRGVEAAVGEYISFIDSDDWIEADMYRNMLIEASVNAVDIIICDMLAEKQNNSTIIRGCHLSGMFTGEQLNRQIYSNMLFDYSRNTPGMPLTLCNKLFRSTIAKRVFAEFPNDITYGEDALGSLVCLLCSTRIYIMENSAFYHYRQADEFLKREHHISLLPRLSNFALNTQIQFSQLKFNGNDQLSGYIAQISLYCIRQILLFNKEYTLRKKFQIVIGYFNEPHINKMLNNAERLVTEKTMQKKIKMINKKHFLLLYLCFYGKEMILRVRRCALFK